ncbi:hypothetical protein B0H11DRAFT_1910225 [Mycena galericulata]|nr:hypothetical protein B0H11DRAFT_1910225 [Mycena galericulata]
MFKRHQVPSPSCWHNIQCNHSERGFKLVRATPNNPASAGNRVEVEKYALFWMANATSITLANIYPCIAGLRTMSATMFCNPWSNAHVTASKQISAYRTVNKDILFSIQYHADIKQTGETVLCPPTSAAEALSRITVHRTDGLFALDPSIPRIATDFVPHTAAMLICSAHLIDEETGLYEIDDAVLGTTKNGIQIGSILLAPTTWVGGLTVVKTLWMGTYDTVPAVLEAHTMCIPTQQTNLFAPFTAAHLARNLASQRTSRGNRGPGSCPTIHHYDRTNTTGQQGGQHVKHNTKHIQHDVATHKARPFPNIDDYLRKKAAIPTDAPVNVWSIPDCGNEYELNRTWTVLLQLVIYGNEGRGMTHTAICRALMKRFPWLRTTSEDYNWQITKNSAAYRETTPRQVTGPWTFLEERGYTPISYSQDIAVGKKKQ